MERITSKRFAVGQNKNKYRNAEKIEVSIQEDGAHVELGTIINELFPQIKTKAGFENPIVDIRAKGTLVPCKDIVSFENLEIGHTYTISGEARWKKGWYGFGKTIYGKE